MSSSPHKSQTPTLNQLLQRPTGGGGGFNNVNSPYGNGNGNGGGVGQESAPAFGNAEATYWPNQRFSNVKDRQTNSVSNYNVDSPNSLKNASMPNRPYEAPSMYKQQQAYQNQTASQRNPTMYNNNFQQPFGPQGSFIGQQQQGFPERSPSSNNYNNLEQESIPNGTANYLQKNATLSSDQYMSSSLVNMHQYQPGQAAPKHPTVASLKQQDSPMLSSPRSSSPASNCGLTMSAMSPSSQMRHSPVSPTPVSMYQNNSCYPPSQPSTMNQYHNSNSTYIASANDNSTYGLNTGPNYQTFLQGGLYANGPTANGPSAYSSQQMRFRSPMNQNNPMGPMNGGGGSYSAEVYKGPLYNSGTRPASSSFGPGRTPPTNGMFSERMESSPAISDSFDTRDSMQSSNGTPITDRPRTTTPASITSAGRSKVNGAKESHPSTPLPGSPGGASSIPDDLDSSLSSPSWPRTPMSPATGRHTQPPMGPPSAPLGYATPSSGVVLPSTQQQSASMSTTTHKESGLSLVQRLMGDAHQYPLPERDDRMRFFERLVHFCESKGHPLTAQPTVSKQTVDLYRLYMVVKQNGGFEQVTRNKGWKELCHVANLPYTSGASYQLRKHYVRYLLPCECYFDRNGIEPSSLLTSIESKRKSKQNNMKLNSCTSSTPPMQQSFVQSPSPGLLAQPSQFRDGSLMGPPTGSGFGQQPSMEVIHQQQHQAPNVSSYQNYSGQNHSAPPGGQTQSHKEMVINPFDDRTPYFDQQQSYDAQRSQFESVRYGSQVQLSNSVNRSFPSERVSADSTDSTPSQLNRDGAVFNGPQHGSMPSSSNDARLGPQSSSTFDQQAAYSAAQTQQSNYRSTHENYPNYYQQYPAISGHPSNLAPNADERIMGNAYGQNINQASMDSSSGSSNFQKSWYQSRYISPLNHPSPAVVNAQSLPQNSSKDNRLYNATHFTQGYGAPYINVREVSTKQLPSNSMMNTQTMRNKEILPHSPYPRDCVETTVPFVKRRRKMYARDLGKIDPWRLVMSLKSGLTFETSYALNALNILLADDSSATYFFLTSLPGLLDILVDLLRRTLCEVFSDFVDFGDDEVAYASTFEPDENSVEHCQQVKVTTSEEGLKFRSFVVENGKLAKTSCFTKTTRTGKQVRYVSPPRSSTASNANVYEVRYTSEYDNKFFKLGGGESSIHLVPKLDDNSLNDVAKVVFNRRCHKRKRFEEIHEKSAKKGRVGEADAELKGKNENSPASGLFFYTERVRCANAEDLNEIAPNNQSSFVVACHRSMAMDRCVGVSNALRSLSFLPGNETFMAKHPDLLRVLGSTLLMGHRHVRRKRAPCCAASVEDIELLADVASTVDDDCLDKNDEKFLPFPDDVLKLVDDAFVVLCNLSATLDLMTHDELVVAPLVDSLLHWAVCRAPVSQDPLFAWANVSPGRYALEILSKLCVLEHNVDLILATPPWSRLEMLIELLVDYLCINEETVLREFSIVLLHTICTANPIACVVAALRTPAVQYLISFLEFADTEMHRVFQFHGMQTLRDNPEVIGTSVGMLRRAASALLAMTKVMACHCRFYKHQLRLLTFTMSHLMDSRVGATIAEALYEIQKTSAAAQASTWNSSCGDIDSAALDIDTPTEEDESKDCIKDEEVTIGCEGKTEPAEEEEAITSNNSAVDNVLNSISPAEPVEKEKSESAPTTPPSALADIE